MFGDSAELGVHQILVEQHVDDAEQQRRVRARARREVPVGQFGGAGAGRVDHRQPAPRLRSAFSLPPKSAAVARLPLDTSGLAPITTR